MAFNSSPSAFCSISSSPLSASQRSSSASKRVPCSLRRARRSLLARLPASAPTAGLSGLAALSHCRALGWAIRRLRGGRAAGLRPQSLRLFAEQHPYRGRIPRTARTLFRGPSTADHRPPRIAQDIQPFAKPTSPSLLFSGPGAGAKSGGAESQGGGRCVAFRNVLLSLVMAVPSKGLRDYPRQVDFGGGALFAAQ